ncbi:MAG TPA: thioredoxin family protein [Solirubrobacteraceae bacterium]|nr:thioredoxin family protein [Solirubrobacteraceae bacterium]
MSLGLGQPLPEFLLPAADGQTVALVDGAQATVVVFTCNHCPYALAWHDRIQQAARDYADRGVRFLQINANDAERYPRDSLEAMRERVAVEDWPMPYLHDETQKVARAFGAQVTPDVFVFDAGGALRYRGAPDDDYSDPSANAQWLRSALDAMLAGRLPDPAETEPVGCSVKWKV